MSDSIPDLIEIDAHAEKQETVMWCWAAVACGVARFLQIQPQPTEAELANLLTGRRDCALKPTPAPCVVPATPAHVVAVYQYLGIDRVGPDLPLSAQTLLSELVAGRPVEVGYLWYQGGGHVALVRGFRKWTGHFLVSDPWFGDGELTYPEIAHGYGIGYWAFSYGRFSKRAKA